VSGKVGGKGTESDAGSEYDGESEGSDEDYGESDGEFDAADKRKPETEG
jgi:hypothetical protein